MGSLVNDSDNEWCESMTHSECHQQMTYLEQENDNSVSGYTCETWEQWRIMTAHIIILLIGGKSEWRRSEFGVRIIEYTAEYRRIDEYSFVIYNTCSIGACAYRVILDKL